MSHATAVVWKVGTDTERNRELMAMIAAQSERPRGIVNDILTAETLTSGLFSLDTEPVELCALVGDAVTAAHITEAHLVELGVRLR